MSVSNTSFEYILHSIHKKHDLICELVSLVHKISTYINIDSPLNILEHISKEYNLSYHRFTLSVVPLVSSYYTITSKMIDQFNSQNIHIYSSNPNHYNSLNTLDKCENFNIEELINIFKKYCHSYEKFKTPSDPSQLKRTREKTWAIYKSLCNLIARENVYDLAEAVIHNITALLDSITILMPIYVKKLKAHKRSKDEIEEFKTLISQFKYKLQRIHSNKIELKPEEDQHDVCECGSIMQVMVSSSEMVCDNCGYTYELKGTVFDDNQFYSQEGTRYKHAGYEPSKHCKCWLERIQAKETNTITPDQIDKIEQCIKRDGITNKRRINIQQLRKYLKDSQLTELNEHVSLIRKLITGINPPQLTFAESNDITNSFSKAVKAYNLIRPSGKSNIPFYPYLLLKLIEMHVVDFYKRKDLLSFIHIQSPQTLIQNDRVWMKICTKVPTFVYQPTDPHLYV